MKILVTGSAGFIGSAFVRLLLGKGSQEKASQYKLLEPIERVVSLDLLTYAASTHNLDLVSSDSRHEFVKGDICDTALVQSLVSRNQIDTIVNFAAESHVDRSIVSSHEFARSNVLGTTSLLDVALKSKIRFLQISTDEVYGTLGDSGSFVETMPLEPNSPYSASKAAADCFVRSYYETHKLPCMITRCSNNYGPYQFPEKFLPLAITNLIRGKKIPVYGTGKNVRDWLHVEDHCWGIYLAMMKGEWDASVYNLGGFGEVANIEMAQRLIALLGKDESSIEYVEDRKGHDWRYSMDSRKAQRELGWRPAWNLEEGLAHMVSWYQQNKTWWESHLG